MFHTSVNSKTIMTFSTMAIASSSIIICLRSNTCKPKSACSQFVWQRLRLQRHPRLRHQLSFTTLQLLRWLRQLLRQLPVLQRLRLPSLPQRLRLPSLWPLWPPSPLVRTPLTGTSERQKERGHHFLFFMNSYVSN